MNLVSTSVNRHLNAYENWNNVRQRADQKVSAFKTYLEELEGYMSMLSEEHKINFFLVKFKPELKDKILSIDNVPNNREEIFAKAFM